MTLHFVIHFLNGLYRKEYDCVASWESQTPAVAAAAGVSAPAASSGKGVVFWGHPVLGSHPLIMMLRGVLLVLGEGG